MKSFLAGALVATIVSAGVTYAVASGSTDTVTACAHTKTGDLRMMTGKKCKKSERKVTWPSAIAPATQGATGAAGLQGDPGPAGLPGNDGVNGVSQIYSHSSIGSWANSGEGWKQIETFYLPQGAFLLLFSIQVSFESGTNHGAICRLTPVANSTDSGLSLSARTTTSGSILSIQNHYVLDEPDEISVECNSTGDSRASFVLNNYAIATDSVSLYSRLQPCAQHDSTAAGC